MRDLLRVLTCGSVDDGKSTLIGRLLYDRGLVADDVLASLEADSRRAGTVGEGALDLSLLLDGLQAEREQGITIDVAYRYFATDARRFIVADSPGHAQYTRNMVTGASNAELAVVLVDARSGVVTQTRRHSYLVSLLGIRHVVLAVNKIDLVGYRQDAFDDIVSAFGHFCTGLDGELTVQAIPLSALHGDNVVHRSERLGWYCGPTLLEHLETVDVEHDRSAAGLRLPVQYIIRGHDGFRGLAGTVVSGEVRPGDEVVVLPAGTTSRVERIVTMDGDLPVAVTDQAVALCLADELDVSRGDLVCLAGAPAEVADQFEAHIVWMHEQPMLAGRPYLLKLGSRTMGLTLDAPKYRIDVDTMAHEAATTLGLNEIGVCNVHFDRPAPFDPYRVNRDTGGFLIIDRTTGDTLGVGLLGFALRRSHNVRWHDLVIDRSARARRNGHRPALVWFTGLSGAGKSTIADRLEQRLFDLGVHTYLLDGDNVRHGLNRDLGFTDAARVENIRRVAEVAKLMVDAGLVVLVSLISPFAAERRMARELLEPGEFFEVHVDTPLAVAEARDPKGLYAKARRGELPNFTGIDSPYEAPTDPELRIDTSSVAVDDAVDAVVSLLAAQGVLPSP